VTEAAFEGPGPDVRFREFLAAGELQLQYCAACAAVTAQMVVLCPSCGAPDLTWRRASGHGTVYSVTVVRSGPGRDAPYCVALIDLDEGARVMSRVEGVAPDAVHIGMAVVAEVVQPAEGEAYHIFRPAETQA